MRRRLLLLRHGEVDYFPQGRPVPPEGVGLTERGRAQARAVGALLREVPLDLALHSGLPRTEETLALVLGGRSVPVEAWPEFQEIRPGRLKDLPDPRRAFLEAFRPQSLEERFLGGERYQDFLERVLAAYRRLLERAWDTLLLVAHGGGDPGPPHPCPYREAGFPAPGGPPLRPLRFGPGGGGGPPPAPQPHPL